MNVAGLKKKTKSELVKIAYSIGCSEKSICSELRGPLPKPAIIESIIRKMEKQKW